MKKYWYAGILIVAGSVLFAGCTLHENDNGTRAERLGNPFAGGLAWGNWTDAVAGGSGYPAGFDSGKKDFLRCKSCHGWDGLGLNGGYVRRSANQSRPKPTPDADLSAKFGSVTEKDVWYSEGRDFGALNDEMPAFDRTGGLSASQVSDVVAFLNRGPKIGDFAGMDISKKPVAYSFADPDLIAGGKLYGARCASCHSADGTGSGLSLGEYFREDGKYSEGFHKMVYGAGGTSVMTREASGELTGRQAADILAYIQANLGNIF